jgi:hypothetical protein
MQVGRKRVVVRCLTAWCCLYCAVVHFCTPTTLHRLIGVPNCTMSQYRQCQAFVYHTPSPTRCTVDWLQYTSQRLRVLHLQSCGILVKRTGLQTFGGYSTMQ